MAQSVRDATPSRTTFSAALTPALGSVVADGPGSALIDASSPIVTRTAPLLIFTRQRMLRVEGIDDGVT